MHKKEHQPSWDGKFPDGSDATDYGAFLLKITQDAQHGGLTELTVIARKNDIKVIVIPTYTTEDAGVIHSGGAHTVYLTYDSVEHHWDYLTVTDEGAIKCKQVAAALSKCGGRGGSPTWPPRDGSEHQDGNPGGTGSPRGPPPWRTTQRNDTPAATTAKSERTRPENTRTIPPWDPAWDVLWGAALQAHLGCETPREMTHHLASLSTDERDQLATRMRDGTIPQTIDPLTARGNTPPREIPPWEIPGAAGTAATCMPLVKVGVVNKFLQLHLFFFNCGLGAVYSLR